MRTITYSKAAKNLIRFFCIIGILVELLSILRYFLQSGFTLDIPEINSLNTFFNSDFNIAILDFASLIFFVIVLFLPTRISLFAIITFIYSFKIILIDTLAKNPIGQPLYLMGISCLLFIGFFKTYRAFKIIFSVVLNFILIASNIRFGLEVMIQSFIASLGYGLSFLVTLFFTANFLKYVHAQKTARIWDLSQYPELTQRDKEWLKCIIDEKRYEEIANEYGITVGTLKNRMHQIFSIVGIEDRISLLGTYGGYEVKF